MSYISAYCHFVFRTKRNMNVLTPINSEHLFRYIHGICKKRKCVLIRINGMSDHVHIAIGINSEISIAELMQEIKRGSSIWISNNRQLFPNFESWATGYFCSTFSRKDMDKVVSYIKNQQKHHLGISLYDEMKQFFIASGLDDKLEYFFMD